MPKVLDIWLAKITFLEFGLQFVFAQSVNDTSQMSFMLVCIVAINKNII